MRGSYLNDPCRDLRDGEPDDEPRATEPSLVAQDRAEDLLCEFVAGHPPQDLVIRLARHLEIFAAEWMGAAMGDERIESVIKERDVGRAKISGLLDAAERLLEHYSDGLPEHLTEEFRDAVINARKP